MKRGEFVCWVGKLVELMLVDVYGNGMVVEEIFDWGLVRGEFGLCGIICKFVFLLCLWFGCCVEDGGGWGVFKFLWCWWLLIVDVELMDMMDMECLWVWFGFVLVLLVCEEGYCIEFDCDLEFEGGMFKDKVDFWWFCLVVVEDGGVKLMFVLIWLVREVLSWFCLECVFNCWLEICLDWLGSGVIFLKVMVYLIFLLEKIVWLC